MFKVNNKDTRMMPAMLLKIEKSVANGSPLTVLLFSQAFGKAAYLVRTFLFSLPLFGFYIIDLFLG